MRHTYGGIVADLDGSTAIKGAVRRRACPQSRSGRLHRRLGHMHHGDDGLFGRGSRRAVRTGARCSGLDEAYAASRLEAFTGYLGKDGIAPKDVISDMREVMSAPDIALMKTGKGLSRGSTVWEIRAEVLPHPGSARSARTRRCSRPRPRCSLPSCASMRP
ncbi:MAG: hypothetical protein ACLUPV_06940 [Bilophila wadsworthia]